MEFIENKGQWDNKVNFRGDFTTGSFFLENRGFTVMMHKPEDLQKLSETIKLERDELFEYTGLSTVASLYLLKDEKGNYLETPQMFWMRIAMGLSYNESDPTAWAIKFYNKMSALEYLSAGSTNIGAGTPNPKLSNCLKI